jgi:hypothetical protein
LCKFIKALVEHNFGEDMQSHRDLGKSKYRQFDPIKLKNDLWLSIQASYAHYSRPRETFDNLEDYTHWEMALFTKEEFICVSQVVPDFNSLAELELYFEGSVYPYVPKDLVEELYLELKKSLQVADKDGTI